MSGNRVVLYPYSTSNHNLRLAYSANRMVVLYLYSTSNHNFRTMINYPCLLSYIFILHQTTTCLYIPFPCLSCLISLFYIKPQLCHWYFICIFGCLISLFYIKPQRQGNAGNNRLVVLYLYSTSNHNWWRGTCRRTAVVLYLYSTSNHNCRNTHLSQNRLSYIFILHQTTT